MSKENIKEIHEQIFNEVYPQVRANNIGLLYDVIQIILREKQPPTQEETLELCNYLGIKSSACREDDLRILDGLVEVVKDTHPSIKKAPAKFARKAIKRMLDQPSEKEKMEEMKWIIVGTCILVGMSFCIKYRERVEQQKIEQERGSREGTRQQLPPPSPMPAALCLVVPAKKISSTLKIGSRLSASLVEDLINNASYFLCIRLEDINSCEQELEQTKEAISPDSNREVYIRVDIGNGQDLIEKKITYLLKTNLPTNGQFTIKQLACLKSLSGLEVFNRV